MGEQRKIRRRRKILRIFKFWYCRILLLKRISGVIHFENPRKIPPAAGSLPPSLSLSLSLSENIIIYKEMSTRSFLNSDQNFDTKTSVTLQSQDSRRTALCWWYLVLPSISLSTHYAYDVAVCLGIDPECRHSIRIVTLVLEPWNTIRSKFWNRESY